MKNVFIRKVDGKIEIQNIENGIIRGSEYDKELCSAKHLCNKCDNCYADECLKVFDEEKRTLGEYDFIKSGIQIYDENDKIRSFYVTKCINFKKDAERKKFTTQEELENLKRLKESIKILYFDAESIEEADQTHLDLLKRKQLVYPKKNKR